MSDVEKASSGVGDNADNKAGANTGNSDDTANSEGTGSSENIAKSAAALDTGAQNAANSADASPAQTMKQEAMTQEATTQSLETNTQSLDTNTDKAAPVAAGLNEDERQRKRRNLAIALGVGGFILLIYLVTVLRIGASVAERSF